MKQCYGVCVCVSVCLFVSIMGGPAAPADWQGALNFTYRVGPSFQQPHDDWSDCRYYKHCSASASEPPLPVSASVDRVEDIRQLLIAR